MRDQSPDRRYSGTPNLFFKSCLNYRNSSRYVGNSPIVNSDQSNAESNNLWREIVFMGLFLFPARPAKQNRLMKVFCAFGKSEPLTGRLSRLIKAATGLKETLAVKIEPPEARNRADPARV